MFKRRRIFKQANLVALWYGKCIESGTRTAVDVNLKVEISVGRSIVEVLVKIYWCDRLVYVEHNQMQENMRYRKTCSRHNPGKWEAQLAQWAKSARRDERQDKRDAKVEFFGPVKDSIEEHDPLTGVARRA